jgi:hypothetical protein
MESSMKTIIALLTTTMLAAGATTAMAAPQGSNQAADYALSLQAAQGSGGFGGAYASAREPGQVHNSTFAIPAQNDFQLQGR